MSTEPVTVHSARARPGEVLPETEVARVVAETCVPEAYRGKRVLLIIPDGTRTAPMGQMFRLIHERIGSVTRALDVIIALGTHPPMSQEAIDQRLEISADERGTCYKMVRIFNHAWNDPAALKSLGTISAEEIAVLSEGRFAQEIEVRINRLIDRYDELMIVGPVFPHEVVGFSGGNKYLFPGISGPEVLNFFHWLGAVVTNPNIIGHKATPVRRVVDRAAGMAPMAKTCFCLVVVDGGLAGVFAGSPEAAWDVASDLSAERHIIYKPRPFHTILSCAPAMYDELWVAGKCMYKLEPVLADGGELIIYAPHLREISQTHGRLIMEIGYHCRDYFLAQWDRFKGYPWGVLAHATHVFGSGTFVGGVETPRARVTLATGLSPDICARLNLGYRDPATIRPQEFAHREEEGVLLVPKAGEELFRLQL